MKHIKGFNESNSEDLVRLISEDEFFDRLKNSPTYPKKYVELISEQIDKIEKYLGHSFNIKYSNIDNIKYQKSEQNMYIYNRDTRNMKSPNLFLKFIEIDDNWVMVELYTNWHYYYFICDEEVGLEEFGDKVIEMIKNETH